MLDLLPHEIIVDNFAGGGGTSSGLERGFNRPVDIAINHDPIALAMHRINHPQTTHYCESVWDIDPVKVTGNQPVALVWLSPDCRHFSKAKGGLPVEKQVRGLAWVGLRWAAKVRPRVIILENVPEFETWGPLGPDGKPCKKRMGNTFRSFVNALKRHGYNVEFKGLRASNYGAPTLRYRFILIARRDGLPIRWPKHSHIDPKIRSSVRRPCQLWITAADKGIDFNTPCLSIFGRKKPLKPATIARLIRGIDKFIYRNPNPFILNDRILGYKAYNDDVLILSHLSKMKKGCTGQELSEPIHSLTTVNQFAEVRVELTKISNEMVLKDPFLEQFEPITLKGITYRITDISLRMVQPKELFRAQGFPDNYIFTHGLDEFNNPVKLTKTQQYRMVGNSVPPDLAYALVVENFKHELSYNNVA